MSAPETGGPAQLRVADVAGVGLRWAEQGAGRPVVLVHGIPTGPRLWRHVLPRLEGARALAWEMVGYAGSIAEGSGRDISVAQQAEYLAAWLRAQELGPVLVVGHDLGGGVAQILAVRHRELVRGLVLTKALPMPADHRLGRDECQVLAPAGTQAASQDPQHLVPGAQPGTWSASSGTGQDSELMAQQ